VHGHAPEEGKQCAAPETSDGSEPNG